MPSYSVRNVKPFSGRNGPGFSATLYNGGRKVAEVLDEAHGAAFRFHWLAAHLDDRAADETALESHVATLPNWHPADPLPGQDPAEGYAVDRDTFVAGLVDAQEAAARYRRKLRTTVVFLTADGQLRQLNGTMRPDAATLARIPGAFPGCTVLNSLPTDEAVAILSQHAKA